MPNASWIPEANCAIAQSLGILGDAWDLLVIRDLARGHHRFDELAGELGISRKVLTQRLRKLLVHDLVERRPYSRHPVRHEYWLTPAGLALVPILVALQDWGDTWLLGDGSLTGLGTTAASQRVSSLVGTVVPDLSLPSTAGGCVDVLEPGARTVLFGFPMAPVARTPDGFDDIPGAMGCTLENRLFRAAYGEFKKAGVGLRGVSTQRPEEQRAFSKAEGVPFVLLSDSELRMTMALRLPTFHSEIPRLRRIILIVDANRIVTDVLFPITDVAGAVKWALNRLAAR